MPGAAEQGDGRVFLAAEHRWGQNTSLCWGPRSLHGPPMLEGMASPVKSLGFLLTLQREEDGRDQLPVCPQEAALQESGSSADP